MKRYAVVLVLAGCGWMGRFHSSPGDEVTIDPPSPIKGDIEFVFSNSTDRPICSLQIDPQGAPPGPSWIHGGIVKSGDSKYTRIKPGAYHVEIHSCEKGKYDYEASMTVARKTEVNLTYQKYVDERRGPEPVDTDRFDAIVETPEYILHPPACVANEQPTEYNGADCCAAAYHTNPVTGVRVCGA